LETVDKLWHKARELRSSWKERGQLLDPEDVDAGISSVIEDIEKLMTMCDQPGREISALKEAVALLTARIKDLEECVKTQQLQLIDEQEKFQKGLQNQSQLFQKKFQEQEKKFTVLQKQLEVSSSDRAKMKIRQLLDRVQTLFRLDYYEVIPRIDGLIFLEEDLEYDHRYEDLEKLRQDLIKAHFNGKDIQRLKKRYTLSSPGHSDTLLEDVREINEFHDLLEKIGVTRRDVLSFEKIWEEFQTRGGLSSLKGRNDML